MLVLRPPPAAQAPPPWEGKRSCRPTSIQLHPPHRLFRFAVCVWIGSAWGPEPCLQRHPPGPGKRRVHSRGVAVLAEASCLGFLGLSKWLGVWVQGSQRVSAGFLGGDSGEPPPTHRTDTPDYARRPARLAPEIPTFCVQFGGCESRRKPSLGGGYPRARPHTLGSWSGEGPGPCREVCFGRGSPPLRLRSLLAARRTVELKEGLRLPAP